MIRSNLIGDYVYKESWNCFLFSLKNKDDLPAFKAVVYRHSELAICASDVFGPTFGGGLDLYIANNVHVSSSYANLGSTYKPPNGYTYYTPKCKALLAGTEYFTPTEVEVYYLP